jgi:hypothetical protein
MQRCGPKDHEPRNHAQHAADAGNAEHGEQHDHRRPEEAEQDDRSHRDDEQARAETDRRPSTNNAILGVDYFSRKGSTPWATSGSKSHSRHWLMTALRSWSRPSTRPSR